MKSTFLHVSLFLSKLDPPSKHIIYHNSGQTFVAWLSLRHAQYVKTYILFILGIYPIGENVQLLWQPYYMIFQAGVFSRSYLWSDILEMVQVVYLVNSRWMFAIGVLLACTSVAFVPLIVVAYCSDRFVNVCTNFVLGSWSGVGDFVRMGVLPIYGKSNWSIILNIHW